MDWKGLNWSKGLKYALFGGGGLLVVSQLGKIIRGIFVGLILIALAFFITWSSVKSIKENSKTVEALELQAASEIADGTRGLVKVYGQITPKNILSLDINQCADASCLAPSATPRRFDNMIFYKVSFERFEVVKKEKTETDSNGTRRTITEYTEDWVALDSKTLEDWSDLTIASIPVNPDKAKIKVEEASEITSNVFLPNLPSVQTYGQSVSEAVGDVRANISYITADNREYIVVGEMRENGITDGETFVISDKTNDDLISSLKTEENMQRWGMRIVAFLLLTFGLTSMLSPVLVFTDLIPLVGAAARTVATFVSAIISAIVIGLTVLLINYWWIFFILMLIFIVFFIKRLMEGKDKDQSIHRLDENIDKKTANPDIAVN